MIALIDADIIAYRCAAAGEEDEWGDVQRAVDNTIYEMFRNLGLKKYIFFLTGDNNFRLTLATTKPYKGNRKDVAKPRWLANVRQHLVDNYAAMVVQGFEADDALASARRRYRSSVICTIDKDLYQVDGFHYNFVKDKLFYVSDAQAEWNLWEQVVSGDVTDNIPGLPRVGPAKYRKAYEGAELSCAEIAYNLYEEHGQLDIFNEQIELIRMRTDLQFLPYEKHFYINDDNFEQEHQQEGFDIGC